MAKLFYVHGAEEDHSSKLIFEGGQIEFWNWFG